MFTGLIREALGNAKCAFTLKINGKESMKTSGKGLENCIFELFGKSVLKNMIKTDFGYLGNQEIMKSTKEFIFTYFNGRYAKSQAAESGVIDGYYTKTPKGKYPFVILFIDIPPGEIDVNVHPSKKIVKFSNGTKVYDLIKNSIEVSFSQKEMEFMPVIESENKEEKINYNFREEMERQDSIKLFETREPVAVYDRRDAEIEEIIEKKEIPQEKTTEYFIKNYQKAEEKTNDKELNYKSENIKKELNLSVKVIGQMKNTTLS